MKDSTSDSASEMHVRPHLALAQEELQGSLAVTHTPHIIEELLATLIEQADEYLRRQVQPFVIWFS